MRVNLNGIHELRLTLPGTTTGAIAAPGITSIVNAGFNGVNAQTGTSYTIQSSDNQKLLAFNNAGAVAVTLPQAGTAGIDGNFAFWVTNEGAGNVTLTPTVSTIDGLTSLALGTGQGVVIFTDGTNYFSVKGAAGGAITSLTGDVTATGPGAAAAQVVATHLTAPLPVNQGGTGTATPSLVAGSNVTITGSWPNQTIAATGGGGGGGSVSFGSTAPAPVQMQSVSQTGSAITFSNSVLAGDIIAVQYRSQVAITASTISDSLGTVYTLAKEISGEPNNMRIWIGTAPTKGVCKVTIGSPGGSFDGISAMEIAGVSGTVDTTVSSYNSTSPYSLPITTTVANDFIFAAVGGFHNADTFTFSGDFTLAAPSDGADAQAIGYCTAGAAGTYTLTVTIGGAGADNSPAILVAIEPVTPPAGSDGDLYFWTIPSPYKGFVYHSGAWHSF